MKKILICGGVYGRDKSLDWLREAVQRRRPEGILFTGGVLDQIRQHAVDQATWTHEEGRFVEKFFKALGELGVFTAVIPGPMDLPLEDFLRVGMHAEVDFPTIRMAHATLIEKGDVAISGLGGCLKEANHTPGCCSRTLAEYHLRTLWTAKQPRKILLLPAPPPGVLGGTAGSRLANSFIDSYHPSLCVASDSSEHRGVETVGSTLIVNPGCLAEGWAAWLDWNQKAAERVEFFQVRDARQGVPADIGVMD